jgi:hypothetical protein
MICAYQLAPTPIASPNSNLAQASFAVPRDILNTPRCNLKMVVSVKTLNRFKVDFGHHFFASR